jgi:hypothetical protein
LGEVDAAPRKVHKKISIRVIWNYILAAEDIKEQQADGDDESPRDEKLQLRIEE